MEAGSGLSDYRWDATPMDRHAWIEATLAHGWKCRFDAHRSGPSSIDTVHAGHTRIVNIVASWQSVSPLLHRISAPWNSEDLIVKVVRRGVLSIEQRAHTRTFGPGDIAVLDPQHAFNESMGEPMCMSALRLPKVALRERGLRHRFPVVFSPNPSSPDVGVVRDVLLTLASQASKAGERLRARLGDQCLDLMEVLLNDGNAAASARSNTVTVLRAKQLIARRIGDPDLSVDSIAAELNISPRSLMRALQANGLSAMRYAWSLRLEHAARLLPETLQGEIQLVAYRCGFASPGHFSRAFKERYGMTPREYAATYKAASVDPLDRAKAAQGTGTA
ncbi:HTH-type transcriptional activator RhaS [Paraburkholderia humisilvae]|uniref:HTH-type transcriptional activator RhaS n=2 Tax=Paraburkholderia humisilvae TaxID=627669 RepID=A0A6J5ENL8_9BURK|nr:HTH-type transcriptional activator RhaS [Paraburkholderia humisilvae]